MSTPLFFLTFRERVEQHFLKYGSCPIEDGTIGKLADHECKHGFLPGEEKATCRCHEPKRAKP